MKKVLLVMMIAMMGCSDDRAVEAVVTAKDGTNGTSCSVAPEYSEDIFGEFKKTSVEQVGARISCTDGSFAIIMNGQNGEQGIQGEQGLTGATGQAGASCTASRLSWFDAVKIQCGNQHPVYMYDGRDGEDGRNGRDGQSCSVKQLSNGARITCGNDVAFVYNGTNGTNGSSCSVSNLSNGARITCGNTSQDLYDGRNGTNGAPGAVGPQGAVGPVGPQGPQGEPGENALANAIGIASYIRPCGNEFDNDEIFLRMTDGNILALYDGGPHEDRLVLLAPGNYITTDRNKNRTCHFTVNSNLQLVNERVQ